MNIISCSAGYGAGGLGGLLAEAVERARALRRPFHYFAGAIRSGDESIATAIRPALAPLLCRIPPIRFDPGWRQMLSFDLFDRAVARRLEAPSESVLAFCGQALHTFRQARRAGGQRLELLSPTAHLQYVWQQHRKAYQQYPLERDWLSRAHLDKGLAEYEMADVILVVSEYARQTFLAAGIPPQKLQRIGVTAHPRFAPPAQRVDDGVFRIVYTGALTVTKGVPLLIDAFERISLRQAELLLIGGSGSRGMRRFLEARCRRDPRIRILPGDPLPHLQRADLYVHPSYQDGFPYAVAEAMACAVPVVVTEDTGVKEQVVEGVNGWIVPTGNVDAIAEAIERAAPGRRPAPAANLPAHSPS